MTTVPPERTPRQIAEEDAGGRMSFFEHLIELRKRLISSLMAIGVGAVIGLLISKHFINFIVVPMQTALRANHLEPNLYYKSPAAYISLVITLGIYLGIVLAMPWVLYQIWKFCRAGPLQARTQRGQAGFIISSMFLFICGIAFAYFVMIPHILTFLVSFANDGPIKPLTVDIGEYFDLILLIIVGMGNYLRAAGF